ncbi:MAG: TatD family hydrolase [Planctomycetota bacterium]|nr:TatD family hydrolase [Planctomycetota bacterium]
MITDTHSHLFWNRFDDDRDEVIARAKAAGVERMLVVGTTLETSRSSFELAAMHDGLFPTAGVHPHDVEEPWDAVREEIAALCAREECVAVGETGLDYFRDYSPHEAQRDWFRWHLELATKLDKPVIVHCREANEDTVRILSEYPDVRGVMHCYVMGEKQLGPYLDMGFYISFSGVVTYPKNDDNRAAAAAVPADRILVETDCPFLAPQPMRGKRNEPSFVTATLDAVATVRGEEPASLALQTSRNAAALFGLPPV